MNKRPKKFFSEYGAKLSHVGGTRVRIHVVANPQKAVKPSPLTPKHKQQQSNNSLIDNLPSLCLEAYELVAVPIEEVPREHASFLRFSIDISAIPIDLSLFVKTLSRVN
jgi:hypothetical protein